MQLFRTLCVVAVLGALTYGAYVTLTGSPPVEPPLDAVNWGSTPHVELPSSSASVASATAAAPASTASAPAPKFTAGPSSGTAKLDTPTDAFAKTPLKPAISGVRPVTSSTGEPPLSYPSTGAAPGPFDTAGSTPLTEATPAPPVGSQVLEGPVLPGTSLSAATGTSLSTPGIVAPTAAAASSTETNNASHILAPQNAVDLKVPWTEIQALTATNPAAALEKLSIFFDDPALSPEEGRRVQQTLDQLAGAVIYSHDHLLEPAHTVQPGESLQQIAAQYEVTPELLAKINGLVDPANLPPGTQLKVVRGPFGALADKSRGQLSVFLGGLYAGSFGVGFGQNRPAVDGQYSVMEKAENRVVGHGTPILHPNGVRHLIHLGDGMAIHTDEGGSGCIGVRPEESGDVYDILTVGSLVIVRP